MNIMSIFGELIKELNRFRDGNNRNLFPYNRNAIGYNLLEESGLDINKITDANSIGKWIDNKAPDNISSYFPNGFKEEKTLNFLKRHIRGNWLLLQESFSAKEWCCRIDCNTNNQDIFYQSLVTQFMDALGLPTDIPTNKSPELVGDTLREPIHKQVYDNSAKANDTSVPSHSPNSTNRQRISKPVEVMNRHVDDTTLPDAMTPELMLNIFFGNTINTDIVNFLASDDIRVSSEVDEFIEKMKSIIEKHEKEIGKTVDALDEKIYVEILDFILELETWHLTIGMIRQNCSSYNLLRDINEDGLTNFEKSVLVSRSDTIEKFRKICINNNLSMDDFTFSNSNPFMPNALLPKVCLEDYIEDKDDEFVPPYSVKCQGDLSGFEVKIKEIK